MAKPALLSDLDARQSGFLVRVDGEFGSHGSQSGNAVNIFLQDRTTFEYVDGDGEWTYHRKLARNFVTGHEALLFCLSHGLRHVQVLVEFQDGRLDLTVPVTDARMKSLGEETSVPPAISISSMVAVEPKRRHGSPTRRGSNRWVWPN